jgi:type I restriction enzyme S subunit
MPLVAVADIRFSNVDKKSYASEKPVRLCNYTDVFDKEYVRGDEDFMHATASEGEISRFAVKAGDVIITKDSETPDEIGVPAAVLEAPNDLLCGYHLALIRPRADQVDPVFLAKQLAHTRISRYYARLANGLTRYGLTNAVVENTPVWLPDLAEQHRAAAILRGIDRAIGKTEALIAKLKAIKQGLLHDLLTRGLDDNGELRDPEKHPEQFKDTPLGRRPSEWAVTTLGGVVQFCPGYGFPEKFQGQKEGDLPFFKVSDMDSPGNDPLLTRASHYVSRDLAQRNGWKPLPQNAVAFAKVGAALLLNRRRILGQSSLIDNNMMVAIAGPEVRETFIYWWLQTIDFGAVAQTTALPSVNQTQLGRIVFVKPPLDEQDRLVSAISSHDLRIRAEEAYLSKLKAIKKGLMQDLLTGRVRVPAEMIAALSKG